MRQCIRAEPSTASAPIVNAARRGHIMKNTLARKIRHYRDVASLQRAIAGASTPAMRDELILLAQRQS